MNHYDRDAYQFDLPTNLIAQDPHNPADQCKIMCIDTTSQKLSHNIFKNVLLSKLGSDSVIFFNNSKVLKARIPITFWSIDGELFFVRYVWDGISEFLVRPGKKCKIGTTIAIWPYQAVIKDYTKQGRLIYIDGDVYDILEHYGQMPLPPYIAYDESKSDSYQPVFADKLWSVASPTASLHFTKPLLDQLSEQWVQMHYITLHVWLGTFKWVDVANIVDYDIHPESCEVWVWFWQILADYHLDHKHLICVGTTVCRTIETLPYVYQTLRNQLISSMNQTAIDYRDQLSEKCVKNTPYCLNASISGSTVYFQTKLYITPWFQTLILQDLITNFHLPGSSLLILVASIMGYDLMREAYQQAIKHQYQFYSFGDAMWISRT